MLQRNYSMPPNGVTPSAVPNAGLEVYESGGAGNPSALIDGILFSGGSVRVAVRDSIQYTFGRVVGFDQRQIVGRAQVAFNGNLLPIAVRNYVNAPGTSSGTYPCVDDQRVFMDFFATANTACIGTDVNASLRTEPTAGAAFSSSTPDNDRDHHGPVVEILGQGAQPGNGADFRGFVALDIRNYLNTSSQIYYNDVPTGTTSSTLKDLAARWIYTGGYPGPPFMTPVTPPHAMDQVGLLNGNSTGAAIDALDDRFSPGDAVLVAVYSGLTMQIPDFQMNAPASITLPATGDDDQRRAASRSAATSRSPGPSPCRRWATSATPQNPITAGTLTSSPPFTYSPTPVTPSMGQGTSVTMTNATTAGATPGIYAAWVRGEAGSPYLTVKYQPFALQVGSVTRDFSITAAASESLAPTLGSSATWSFTLKRVGSGSFGSNVALSVEAMPESTLADRARRRVLLLGVGRTGFGLGHDRLADDQRRDAGRRPVPDGRPGDRHERRLAEPQGDPPAADRAVRRDGHLELQHGVRGHHGLRRDADRLDHLQHRLRLRGHPGDRGHGGQPAPARAGRAPRRLELTPGGRRAQAARCAAAGRRAIAATGGR